jgi:hypothetical protein
MQAYLELVATGKMSFAALVDRVVPIDEAPATYAELAKADGALPLGVLIQYPDEKETEAEPARVTLEGHRRAPGDRINYALVGVGAFGTGMLVPQMKKRADRYFLRGVVSRTGTQAATARDNRNQVLAATLTPFFAIRFHLVVIATRHRDPLIDPVLAAGKRVRGEAARRDVGEARPGGERLHRAARRAALMVGFNRRSRPRCRR